LEVDKTIDKKSLVIAIYPRVHMVTEAEALLVDNMVL
jgi:hypothetical protein